MTDAEYIENIGMVSTEKLFKKLEYYGYDSYYADLWNATISELKKRITPTGEWIYKEFDVESGISCSYWCSNCGEPKFQCCDDFCQCCGAKMKE